MVKEELVYGLKIAMQEGETLENAMNTFYNAGYLKDDIEEAAMAVEAPAFSPETLKQLYNEKQVPKAKQLPTDLQNPPRVIQNVSIYEKKPSRTGTAVTIVLVALLLILLGILAAVILFKDQLSGLLGNLFWRALF